MKLVIAVVQHQDASQLVEALRESGHRVRRISSEGGFLHEGNVTLFVMVEPQTVDHVLALILRYCQTRTRYVSTPVIDSGEYYAAQPIEVRVGGATVFVLDIETLQRV